MYQVLFGQSDRPQIMAYLRVVKTSDGSPMRRESEFSYENRRGHAGKGKSETDKESTSDKHADILSGSLNDRPDDNDWMVSLCQ